MKYRCHARKLAWSVRFDVNDMTGEAHCSMDRVRLLNVRYHKVIVSILGPRSNCRRGQRRFVVNAFDGIDVVQLLRLGKQ